jgi:hypothetical protein
MVSTTDPLLSTKAKTGSAIFVGVRERHLKSSHRTYSGVVMAAWVPGRFPCAAAIQSLLKTRKSGKGPEEGPAECPEMTGRRKKERIQLGK